MRTTPDHRQNLMAGASSAAPSAFGQAARRLVPAVTGTALALALSGCVGGVPSGVQPGTAEPTTAASSAAGTGTNPVTAETPPAGPPAAPTAGQSAASPESAATEAVRKTVTDALGRLAAGSPKPATAQVTEALTGAGIPVAALQVSQSRTPTGLEADAIEASVLEGGDCVIGQVRDGAVTVAVLPVLASGKCFVGS
ncbi:DUF6993 domain-containing protein [Pseudarthrobacter sp. NPDC058329]|uniref:DUF6993 domain-containing protein n=1 Tax=Pseudarthrobacter sp. NPDC058329 TaxID=3346448 RepID=UPI0036D8D493